MREQKQTHSGVSVGSSSILVIFVVLALTAFATLSLVSANSDYSLTRRTVESVDAYYAADSAATKAAAQLIRALREQRGGDPFQVASSLDWEIDGFFVTRAFVMNDTQSLIVTADLSSGEPVFTRWQVQNTAEWRDEQSMGLIGAAEHENSGGFGLPVFE